MNKALIIFIAVLSGCATSSQIRGPDGEIAHSIRCGATNRGACFEKAGELCPNGYRVISGSESTYLGQYSNASIVGNVGTATSVPLMSPNFILVSCKKPKD